VSGFVAKYISIYLRVLLSGEISTSFRRMLTLALLQYSVFAIPEPTMRVAVLVGRHGIRSIGGSPPGADCAGNLKDGKTQVTWADYSTGTWPLFNDSTPDAPWGDSALTPHGVDVSMKGTYPHLFANQESTGHQGDGKILSEFCSWI
jgi:hypothetical protein